MESYIQLISKIINYGRKKIEEQEISIITWWEKGEHN